MLTHLFVILLFCSFYIIISSLCVNFFIYIKDYLFVSLKYLFPVSETNYLVLKKIIFKNIVQI